MLAENFDNKMYKDWQLYNVMPEGWKLDKTAGSPLHGYKFINNGKSILNGGKRALLAIEVKPQTQSFKLSSTLLCTESTPVKKQEITDEYRKTLNDLARARFKETLLNDVLIDLQICEIEGWSKLDYIDSLKDLLLSIGSNNASL